MGTAYHRWGGHTVVDVPLPDHPGRWRVEALVIAGDGGGASAHAVVTTQQTVIGRVEVPVALGIGDTVAGRVAVSAPTLMASDERTVLLIELSRRLGEEDSLERVLQQAVRSAVELPGAERGALLLASGGTPHHRHGWTMKQDRRTPGYTTRWGELAVARA